MVVLRRHAAGQGAHGYLLEASGLFPQIRLALVFRGFGQLALAFGKSRVFGQRCGLVKVLLVIVHIFSGHFGQPLLGHLRGEQVRTARLAVRQAGMHRLHKMSAFFGRVEYLLAFSGCPLRLGIRDIQGAVPGHN